VRLRVSQKSITAFDCLDSDQVKSLVRHLRNFVLDPSIKVIVTAKDATRKASLLF
jgi:hypothetical protein